MYLAIVNEETGLVENVIVPPEGATAFFVPNGYKGVMTDIGGIGDTYDFAGEVFIRPEPPEQLEPPAEE